MRRFNLHRLIDETGTSGEGVVAEGVKFTDGTTVLRWLSPTPSTVVYRSFDHMKSVHSHDGKTEVIWRDK